MKNRINSLFEQKPQDVLSIFYTAGVPQLDSTVEIAEALEQSGVDMIEIGIPFSDSLVDGPTIQAANEKALEAGMSIKLLFEQLIDLRKRVSFPVVLMGCINPILQYGVEEFCESCQRIGVDGVILPDLPPEEFESHYKPYFEAHSLSHIFLVTRHTSDERIRYLDSLSDGFIYAVSSEATTGGLLEEDPAREEFLQRLKALKLNNPVMLGFGISSKETLSYAFDKCNGGIIGSAFIRLLNESNNFKQSIPNFIGALK